MVNKITGIKVLMVPITVGLAFVASVLYVKPAYDEMQLAKRNQAELKKQLSNLEGQNKKLSELKTKWDSMSEEKTLVEGSLPSDLSTDYYLAQLYDQASRSGVLLNSVSMNSKNEAIEEYACEPGTASVVASSSSSSQDSSGSSKSSKSAVPASSCVSTASAMLEVSGNWDQLVNFFKYLEETNRIANVTSVDIATSEGSDLLNIKVQTSIYYKEKSSTRSPSVASSLTSGKGFEEGVIKKLNELVFTPYVAPSISESGERNIFK